MKQKIKNKSKAKSVLVDRAKRNEVKHGTMEHKLRTCQQNSQGSKCGSTGGTSKQTK